ncbi:hypothetical protein C21_03865 [Arenibacter sp. NBRC 103722]|nr:hypothetical protein C21_03865 [Arenibacter sp. NBRC 103722]
MLNSSSSFDSRMNRALQKYILLPCILLINGFNTIYAHTNFEVDRYFSILNLAASESFPCEFEEELAPVVFADTSVLEVQKLLVAEVADFEEEEEESDEIVLSPETNLIYGGLATAIFYAQIWEYLSSNLENDLAYIDTHAFTTPYKRYIRFQVFRI